VNKNVALFLLAVLTTSIASG